jgi:pimeloyl-ACP methyl ester carboxylesterase
MPRRRAAALRGSLQGRAGPPTENLPDLLAGLIPQARVKIYPDSAHGFLFQHHAEFAADVEAFLAGPC